MSGSATAAGLCARGCGAVPGNRIVLIGQAQVVELDLSGLIQVLLQSYVICKATG